MSCNNISCFATDLGDNPASVWSCSWTLGTQPAPPNNDNNDSDDDYHDDDLAHDGAHAPAQVVHPVHRNLRESACDDDHDDMIMIIRIGGDNCFLTLCSGAKKSFQRTQLLILEEFE